MGHRRNSRVRGEIPAVAVVATVHGEVQAAYGLGFRVRSFYAGG